MARWLAIAVLAAGVLRASPASAFGLDGHFIIEAAAYRRLLVLARVPDTVVSGRELLAALIAARVLLEPPCFDRARPRGTCDVRARLERPLAFWPTLAAGAADLIIDRQLSARGQCQHFMAETVDGLSPPDPRFGVPAALVTTAYSRCVAILGAAFDGLLRDPGLAQERLVGMYALMHAIQDSFSAAHAARDEQGHITHLLSWTLIDWPGYLARGRTAFPAATHHAITDGRDADYLRGDGVTNDGRRCADLHNPYAMPEECLTPRARAAVDAIADFLVLTYRLRTRAAAAGRKPSLSSPEDRALWTDYVEKHLASAAVPVAAPPPDLHIGVPRADTFVGVQGSVARDGWGTGGWGARMFYGPAVPFALSLAAGAGFSRRAEGDRLIAASGLGLYLPLIRRFSIGVTPAGFALSCDTGFEDCDPTLFATLGELIVPLPGALWLGVQGPRWSWNERALSGPLVAFALGWSHEQTPPGARDAPDAVAAWDPPNPAEAAGYRARSTSWLFFFSATAASTAQNRWLGGGFELRRDRDRWNRRAGWAPAFGVSVAGGTSYGTEGVNATIAPLLRRYLLPNRIWLGAAPAALRVGALAGESLAADVAGLLAAGVIVGVLEVSVASPPLSYVSTERWHALPVSVRLGLLFH
jgi:hypothetical protein